MHMMFTCRNTFMILCAELSLERATQSRDIEWGHMTHVELDSRSAAIKSAPLSSPHQLPSFPGFPPSLWLSSCSMDPSLPPLQGRNLDEHFYQIGSRAAHPWLKLSKEFANTQLPPPPDCWEIQSSWTKYYHRPDGSSYSEHVQYPSHDGRGEEMLIFDVETVPSYTPFAIMACTASANAWYAWLSADRPPQSQRGWHIRE